MGTYHNVEVIDKYKRLGSLQRLQQLSKKVITENTGVSISTVVDHKPIIINILKFAKENREDHIAIGVPCASGLKKVTMGSAAVKVLSKSNISVLLVPEKYVSAPVKDIIFITNFEDTDTYAFLFLFELHSHLDALVTIVNLMNPYAQNRKRRKHNSSEGR